MDEYGAAWENVDGQLKVKHIFVESTEELPALLGSQYVQSDASDCYLQVKKQLKEGRTVLFSGTPCQIAGLKQFLRGKCDALLTVDVICLTDVQPLNSSGIILFFWGKNIIKK